MRWVGLVLVGAGLGAAIAAYVLMTDADPDGDAPVEFVVFDDETQELEAEIARLQGENDRLRELLNLPRAERSAALQQEPGLVGAPVPEPMS